MFMPKEHPDWGGPRKAGPGKTDGRPPKSEEEKAQPVQFRLYLLEKARLVQLTEKLNTTMTGVFRQALKELAEKHGIE